MTRITTALAALAIFATAAFAQAPPPAAGPPAADVTGEWTVYLDDRHETIFRGAIAQTGTKLRGYMGNEAAEFPLTGTVEGTQVKFTWAIIESGKDIPITVTGKIERNEISGIAQIGTFEKVDVTAQRTSK